MKKLFMISLGGKAPGANIEVHDVQFAVGESIDAVIPLVKEQWYGIGLKLHMDSYKEIQGIPGYKIRISNEPAKDNHRLYFAYLGGYRATSTQEVHDVRLIVCESERQAKGIAIKLEGFDMVQTHVDSVVDVEDKLLSHKDKVYYIELVPSDEVYNLEPDWFGYRRLDQ